MSILSIFSNIAEGDTMYVVIAIVVILILWGITKIGNKRNKEWDCYLTFLTSFHLSMKAHI